MSDLLENLNIQQREAVMHREGPLMIIAGAGTGKTTVITRRIAWLIAQGEAKPDEILALTFTDKAAKEMEERVDILLPMGYVDVWIMTFHAFCERLLRQHALDIGLSSNFVLVNEVDAYLLMRKHLHRFELDYYRPKGNPSRFISAMLTHFSRLKDELITPEIYTEFARKNLDEAQTEEEMLEAKRIQELADAYSTYQQLLAEEARMDFGDLLFYTWELLTKRPTIAGRYRDQFKHILVDEFQDTNTAQYAIVKLLVNDRKNITIVGDDDQSIYRFRGASLQNILQFRQDFPDAERVVLRHNYRSRKEILEASYRLIQQNNPHRLEHQEQIDKSLVAFDTTPGQIDWLHVSSADDEVMTMVDRMLLLHEQGVAWGDIAVLVRANAQAHPVIDVFDRLAIPYRFFALSGLYTKPIILDVLAWLRVIDQPHVGPEFYRILRHPDLGIPENDIHTLSLHARKIGISLWDAAQQDVHLSKEGSERLHEIISHIRSLQERIAMHSAHDICIMAVKEVGLYGCALQQSEAEQKELFDYLNQFAKRLKRFCETADDSSLHAFLLDFDFERDSGHRGDLQQDVEVGPNAVQVMTVHASKGLEFAHVFIVNLVEQRFPSQQRAEAIPLPEGLLPASSYEHDHIHEERRLLYVAMTRAKHSLTLLSADSYGGKRKRKPSRFLHEIALPSSAPVMAIDQRFTDAPVLDSETNDTQETLSSTALDRISFTQIAAFDTCPLQHKFSHILRIPVFGNLQLSFGKSMHAVLQHMMEAYKSSGKMLSESAITDLYEQHWIDEWYPDQEIRDRYYSDGLLQLKQFRECSIQDKPIIHSIEKPFALSIQDTSLRGRIDRIDKTESGFEIIDYKTGRPKTALSWKDKRQLVLYALAARDAIQPPMQIQKATYWYMEDGSRMSFEIKERDLIKLEEEIVDTISRMRTSDHAPNPGFHCAYCDYADICEFRAG